MLCQVLDAVRHGAEMAPFFTGIGVDINKSPRDPVARVAVAAISGLLNEP